MGKDVDRIFVVSAPRTGSSMLCDLIEQSSGYVNLCEAINAAAHHEPLKPSTGDNSVDHSESAKTMYLNLIESTVAPHPKCVIKMQRDVSILFPDAATRLGIRLAYLERKDVLASAVSCVLALATSSYLITNTEVTWPFPDNAKVPKARADAIRARIAASPGKKVDLACRAVKMAAARTAMGASTRRALYLIPDVVRFTYEEITANPGIVPERLFGRTGATLTPRTVAQADALNAEIINIARDIAPGVLPAASRGQVDFFHGNDTITTYTP